MLKDIPKLEGKYAVTKDGRVWSYPKNYKEGKFLKAHLLGRGYQFVNLGKTQLIHRLVALTYIPNPNNYPQVNHKNGIKTDNRVKNLEWANNTMNMRHAIKTGLYDLKGTSHPNSKLTDEKVKLIRSIYEGHTLHGKDFSKFPKYKTVAEQLGVTPTLIGQVARREIWTHV
jgi:hypothetical protein